MQKFSIKISIKSFENSALHAAKTKIEHLCSLLGGKQENYSSTVQGVTSHPLLERGPSRGKENPSPVEVTWFPNKSCQLKGNKRGWNNRPYGLFNKHGWNKPPSYISLPPSKKRFTLLQSPHIDKKSREQFQWEVFRGQIGLFSHNKRVASLVLFLLKSSEFPGTQLKVAISYSTPFYS